MGAAGLGIARICCAQILVIAINRLTRLARSVRADIANGARIAVIASSADIDKDAAGLGITTVRGTLFAIATGIISATGASPVNALFTDGAGVIVITAEALVVGQNKTLSGCWYTLGFLTEGLGLVRQDTIDHTLGSDFALIGQPGFVTVEGSITDIVVFKRVAVLVLLAITGNWCSDAGPFIADISQRAGITVIA